MASAAPTAAPTPGLRAATAAPTAVATGNDDDGGGGGGGPGDLALAGDSGVLTSLRYLDWLRTEGPGAANATRAAGSNVDLLPLSDGATDGADGDDTVALCHVSFFNAFTHGDFTPTRPEVEDAFALALALHHLNTGDGSILPELDGLDRRCRVRFTLEMADDQDSGGVALEHVVAQTARAPPDRLPCAFVGSSRSAVSIPLSIVTGFLGYPQVSAYSTSADLDDRTQYPLFGRTIPSDQGNAVPIILFLRDVLQLRHLAVLNVNDAYGNAFADALRDAAARHAPELQILQIPLDDADGGAAGPARDAALEALAASGYRFVFCLVFSQEDTDALLLRATELGVAGDGAHNWLFGDSFTGVLDDRRFPAASPLARAYRGVGLFEATGGVAGMPGYDRFQAGMAELRSGVDRDYIGALLPAHPGEPNYPQSPEENPFLYRDDLLDPVTNSYAALNYEAGIALGLAACRAVEDVGDLAISGVDQYNAFRNSTFGGIGGAVRFDRTTGSRLPTSTLYRVSNWLERDNGDGTVTFRPTLSTLFAGGAWEAREKYVFNDGTTTLPADTAPASGGQIHYGLVVVLPIVVVAVAGLFGFLYYENKRKQNDSIWRVDKSELQYNDPPVVIGQGTFGTVLLAEYRGTQVAVKRVMPPHRDSNRSSSFAEGTDEDFESTMDFAESGKKTAHSSSWGGASLTGGSTSLLMSASNARKGIMSRISKESDSARRKRLKADFMEEMRYLSKLRHPCVTTIMGAVIDATEPMMIMEYMDHGSLYDLLHNETVVLEIEMLLNFLKDIAQGVRFLHSAVPQVIHGDLKAANILVDGRFRAKVADFGLSQKKNLGGTGTPYWMAPELLRGESRNTAATDVYSFGIILYEVYARKDPYEGENLETVIKSIMDKNIQKRPPIPTTMCDPIKPLMADCLKDEPELRPCFEELDNRLKRLNGQGAGSEACLAKSTVSLFDIFPRHIAEALRDGRTVEPEHRDIVTIFFSDIVGFTDISATLEPRKVADMLDRLYTKFDNLSHHHEIFKLETIGDAYVAVTNLVKDQPNDHTKRIAEFAIEAITAANDTIIDPDDPDKGNVHIRVGFHCGPVVADVVGTRNPRYCLFGDSVNTASRMESNSKEDRIHCSDAAAKVLQQQAPEIPLRSRGKIKIKGKGEMRTWWVNEGAGRRGPSPLNALDRDYESRRGIKDSVRGDPLAEHFDDRSLGSFSMSASGKTRSLSSINENSPRLNRDSKQFDMIEEEVAVEDCKASDEPQESAPEVGPAAMNPLPAVEPNYQSHIFSFMAPPGKLGIVIDTSSGQPKVHGVDETSAIRDHIEVGDILCDIDGVDTRRMSHSAISALLLANAEHGRNFTIERVVPSNDNSATHFL